MTARAVPAAPGNGGGPTGRRLRAAVRVEAAVAWRYGVVGLAAALAVLWSLTLAALPAPGAQRLLPLLLFVDTAGFGALIAVGRALFERVERVDAARGTTPLRPWEPVVARVSVLTVLAAAIAVPLALASGVPLGPGAVAATTGGVVLTSVLLVAACLALGGGAATLPGAFLRLVPGVALLITVPVLHLTGAVHTPLTFLVPTTAGAELIRLGTSVGVSGAPPVMPVPPVPAVVAAVAWGTAGAVAACAWAARATAPSADTSGRPSAPPRGSGAGAGSAPGTRRAAASGSAAAGTGARPRGRRPLLMFLRFDLLPGRRDALILVGLAAPVLLSLVLRAGYPPMAALVQSAYGFDPASAAPPVFAALILLHVPVITGSVVALRFMEEADDGALLILRASPLPLRGYIAYRSGLAGLLALIGLAAAVPLSGLAPPASAGLAAAVLLAAAAGPLMVLAITATASNTVEALVAVKALAAVSVLLPVLAWTLPDPAVWMLLAAPPAWALTVLPGFPGTGLPPAAVLACGVLWTLVLCVVAARRTEARLES
ncbi:hypothetical protein [Nocardiopsis baichengensis]|uniref:hypothetical protein n=1 Tax=Nocardiopsis baichengensis TaxID=280240 RepID=UPI00034D5C8B|nr:hypothetical protein [Nocardiopsis baichengensis]